MITENQMFFKKITGNEAKKTKRWTEMQVLTQFFKPIIAANTQSN